MIIKKLKLDKFTKMRKDLGGYLIYFRPYYFLVNQTAYEILCRCDGNNSIEDIARDISEKYNQDYEEVKKDVETFINKYHFLFEL
ncbi:MAG TPA: PqqD family protein [Archaeoglobaceae archaeon]|nr:PqqD family protein [Archaeoglobaceae archaeon]